MSHLERCTKNRKRESQVKEFVVAAGNRTSPTDITSELRTETTKSKSSTFCSCSLNHALTSFPGPRGRPGNEANHACAELC